MDATINLEMSRSLRWSKALNVLVFALTEAIATIGSGRICVDRSGCNNQMVVVDADLDEEAVKIGEANGLDEINEANVADRTNLADEASKTSLADAADTCSLRTRKYVLNNQPALRD